MLALPRNRKKGESYDTYMRYLDKCDNQSGCLMIAGIALLAISAVGWLIIFAVGG